jgi:hypothetical protein
VASQGNDFHAHPAVRVLVRVEVHQREHGVLDPTLVVHGALDRSVPWSDEATPTWTVGHSQE